MTPDDAVPNDDHRGMARRAGYHVIYEDADPRFFPDCEPGWFVLYIGPDSSRRALRDIGPYDNESDAWARAVGLAMTFRDATYSV